MAANDVPPPGAVFERAERAVEYVRRALGVALDYTPETLPVLDHYLRSVPADQPEAVKLVAATAGAYFGEVTRRAIGGEWRDEESPTATLELTGGLAISPAGLAAEAIVLGEVEGYDGSYDVPAGDREAVELALAGKEVAEEEYYSLSGRLETLLLIADVLAGRRATRS